MQSGPAENQQASTSTGELYFFTLWPYEDRVFLRALYKKFACTKVHLMAPIMKSAPRDRWDCGHWNMWRNMANAVRSKLRRQVSPKKMESFFWDVIAQGTDADDVTERLDKLIYGPYAPCPAVHTSSGALVGKVREAESETTSSEEYDESVEDDDDSDFMLRSSRSARRQSKDTGRAAKRARSSSARPEDQRLPSERAASSERVKVRRISPVFDSDVALQPESLPSEVCNVGDTLVQRQAFEEDAHAGVAGEPGDYDSMGAIGHRIAHCSIEPRAAGDEAKPATLALVNDRPPSVCASSTDAATSDPELPHASGEAELDDDYLSPPCAAEERRVSVSPAPCVGDDTPRCDVADGNMSRGSTDQPPDTGLYHEPANTEPGAEVVHESASVSPVVDVDREVTGCSSGAQMNHDAASHVDQGVQCAPTSAEIGVQCSKDPSRIADMMRREHLIRMEILRSHKEALMKKLGLPPP